MKQVNLFRLAGKVRRRLVRSRRGSVLILVVVLLVLMALIGTAYMTMAQFDRVSAVQHSFNTEVDLLLDGVINMTKGTVTGDLFVNGKFRPGTNTYNQGNGDYNYWNGLGYDTVTAQSNNFRPGDVWLSSRVPDLLNGAPVWSYATGPLNGSSQFDSPYWPSGSAVHYGRTQLPPGQVTFGGQSYPAFGQYLAADADGDGVADSGLFKLLTLDGITYYAAVRIIDNCGAINAGIATRPNPTVTFSASGVPGDFSPVNLDLEGMLTTPATELYGGTGLLNYRWNGQASPPANGIDELGVSRNDVAYLPYPAAGTNLYFDQMWFQLGRRLLNPGNITPGTPSPSNTFQALPISESMTMARDFILRDPNIATAASSTSVLEQKLQTTAFTSAPTGAYQPGSVTTWFQNNFNYTAGGTNTMPMRALLVAQNPVSNFAPSKFNDKGTNPTGPFNFGDSMLYNGHRYVCINSGTSAMPTDPQVFGGLQPFYFDPNWAYEPWTNAPTKTSANTASFQQLYAAYWSVMSFTTGGTPEFNGRMFRSPLRNRATTQPAAGGGVAPTLTPAQVLQLRAALAAVNTMDFRDSDNDVTSRTIALTGTGATTYYATIYGMEMQPYITEVYARNDPTATNDFVAVELYNPYPYPITLTNWHLETLDRSQNTLTLTDLAPLPTTTLKAYEHLMLVSDPAATSVVLPAADDQSGVPVTVTQLSQALGKELVLMRPRRADGTLTSTPAVEANNQYDETNATQLVPVDSYDFSNLPATAPDATTTQEWRYVRPSDRTTKSWHFVYPGTFGMKYAAAAGATASTTPTVDGTVAVTPAPTQTNLSSLGQPDTAVLDNTYYIDVPLQVNNVDFGGPLKQTTGANAFPFGGFARNGDLLQVTYIGSYRIFDANNNLVELNPISMDSCMATARDEAGATQYQPYTSGTTAENIGRFCPIDGSADASGSADDFGTASGKWRYHWAMSLFDYLTVQCPQDDYFPEVDPNYSDPTNQGTPTLKYVPAQNNAALRAQPVANSTPGVSNTGLPTGFNKNNATEETAPVNGLVNINTAPWRVLAAVPWVPSSVGGYATQNANVAQAIVRYRDVDDGSGKPHGPFKSIFELNNVPVPLAASTGPLRNLYGNDPTYKTPQYGDISPVDPSGNSEGGPDQVVGDFEQTFLTLNRVSNLITTRSDSYTAYILIQGWRNAESATPTLVVQRRAAIIIDRSTVTPVNTSATIVNVPTN